MNKVLMMKRQRGFTLIEVMVAFLVMAIGMLGVIGLQSTAVRNNFVSTAQMQAVLLAREMADLVRANPAAMLTRAYNSVTGSNVTACASGSGCSPVQMAQFDKYQWDQRILTDLGQGAAGVVCIDSTPADGSSASSPGCDNIGTGWVVKLWWNEGDAAPQTFGQQVTTADLLYRDITPSAPSYFISFHP